MTALRFTEVDHAYVSRVALKSFSLSVEDGEVLCLLGPSGSGKTTALRVAAGLETPQRGSVHIGGRQVTGGGANVAPEDRSVGLLFQDLALFPHLTVAQNVAFGLHGEPAGRRKARVGELLELVAMTSHARAYPHQLSGGQQQRAALARALAPRPRVLLLDEPFTNLDVVLRQQVRREIVALLKSIETAVLFVTHDPEEALFVADRVAVMREGTVAQVGTPEEIFFRPRDRFIASFFGEMNVLAATVAGERAETPFGAVGAPGLADGPADVLVRAQGLRVSTAPAGGNAHAVVRSGRILGPTTLLELEPLPPTGLRDTLIARIELSAHPLPGEQVLLSLDERFAFAFPKATT